MTDGEFLYATGTPNGVYHKIKPGTERKALCGKSARNYRPISREVIERGDFELCQLCDREQQAACGRADGHNLITLLKEMDPSEVPP